MAPADPGDAGQPSLPRGRVALLSAGVSLVAACGLTAAEIAVVVAHGLGVFRAIAFCVLVGMSLIVLMVGSSDLARGLQGWGGSRTREIARLLYWLATSIVTLTGVVVVGAALTLALAAVVNPKAPSASEVVLLFVIDAAVGALVGVLAALWIRVSSRALERVVTAIDSIAHQGPRRQTRFSTAGETFTPDRDQLLRGAALGASGLVLSAVSTALLAPGQPGAGGAPADGAAKFAQAAVIPLIAWLVGSASAWALWEHGITGDRIPRHLRVRSRNPMKLEPHPRVRHGTHASASALALMTVGAFVASAVINQRTTDVLATGPSRHVEAVAVTNSQWNSSTPFVARRFEPIFWLAGSESWRPTSVGYYLQHSRKLNGCGTHGCLELKNCPDVPRPKGCPPSGRNDPALYYRYIDSNTHGFKGVVDPEGEWKLIQYWIFYNYDSLQAGAIQQWHGSDWEQVSVLVQRTHATATPIEVAFSEHCYGARLSAEHVNWLGSHPISYVGLGSHANYPRQRSVPVRQLRCSLGTAPPYLGVAGLFFTPAIDGASLELPVDYLLGIRDHEHDAYRATLGRLIPLDTTPQVSNYKGAWGPANSLSIGSLKITTGSGPPAPKTQLVATQPFAHMLCNAAWLNPGGDLPRWVCATP